MDGGVRMRGDRHIRPFGRKLVVQTNHRLKDGGRWTQDVTRQSPVVGGRVLGFVRHRGHCAAISDEGVYAKKKEIIYEQ